MTAFAETAAWTARRRPLDVLEGRVVRLFLDRGDDEATPVCAALRYVLSFARLTVVRNRDGVDVSVDGLVSPLAEHVVRVLGERLQRAETLWPLARTLPELTRRTCEVRSRILDQLPLDRASLEAEVTTRLVAVASGGGGGAGYGYPGCYETLERAGIIPDLMVGTSIGALMSMFRARRRRWDGAPLVAAARQLSWSGVFRALETENRYGLPAALRLQLRSALGSLFRDEEGRELLLQDMEIPLYIIATGITVEALKYDLDHYEHLLDDEVGHVGARFGVRGAIKAAKTFREFLSRRDALREVVLGRDSGTEPFDVLDAAGFSAAIPAAIHYDVLRDDPRMKRLLDQIYSEYGITRLGEGGMVSNVPARVCWESVVCGRFGRRNVFVLALDCFAPDRRRLAWWPLQQAVRAANVDADRHWADLYVPMGRTLSPINLVPNMEAALDALRWGRDDMKPHVPFIQTMISPIPVLQ